MARCKWCNRSGLFFSVNSDGLCKTCSPIIVFDLNQRKRIIDESLKLIKNSKNIDTKISRADLVIQHLNELQKYEEAGIVPTNPLPSVYKGRVEDEMKKEVVASVADEEQKLQLQIGASTANKIKEKYLIKFIMRIKDLKAKIKDAGILDLVEKKYENQLHELNLNTFLLEAEKAEFKGSFKRALDQYYEALYFIKHDDIDDSLQENHIVAIESKIKTIKKN